MTPVENAEHSNSRAMYVATLLGFAKQKIIKNLQQKKHSKPFNNAFGA